VDAMRSARAPWRCAGAGIKDINGGRYAVDAMVTQAEESTGTVEVRWSWNKSNQRRKICSRCDGDASRGEHGHSGGAPVLE